MINPNSLDAALKYGKLGFSIIPCNTDKKPLVQWQKYQKEKAPEEQIKNWWKQWSDANIGIVTGVISELAVIDIDTEEGKEAIQAFIPDSLIMPVANTPSGGQHLYFKCHDNTLTNNARIITGCDLRANGGYVVAPPSSNGIGAAYTWEKGKSIFAVKPPELPEAYLSFIKNKLHLSINTSFYSFKENVSKNAKNESQQLLTMLTTANRMFQNGTRDNDLFNVANCLLKGGMPKDRTLQVVEKLAKKCCNPPFPEKDILVKIESALKRTERRTQNITADFREWVVLTSGVFLLTDAHKELTLLTRAEKQCLYVGAERLCKEGIIEKYGNKRGQYRKVEATVEAINYLNAELKKIDLKLPFDIDNNVNIYPKNIIVIAGAPDAGKTALLLNVVEMNMTKHKIFYFSSEMGEQEFKLRLSKFDRDIKTWNFYPFERVSNFADVVKPDDINIIDYLEVHEDFWRIGGMIREIYDKLRKGIALIAIQKDKDKEYGLGATRGLEKARLYLTMNPNEIKIVKAKNWADPTKNPNGMKLNFKLFKGCKFSTTSEWSK